MWDLITELTGDLVKEQHEMTNDIMSKGLEKTYGAFMIFLIGIGLKNEDDE